MYPFLSDKRAGSVFLWTCLVIVSKLSNHSCLLQPMFSSWVGFNPIFSCTFLHRFGSWRFGEIEYWRDYIKIYLTCKHLLGKIYLLFRSCIRSFALARKVQRSKYFTAYLNIFQNLKDEHNLASKHWTPKSKRSSGTLDICII